MNLIEWALVLILGGLYLFSFNANSSVNGLGKIHELFEQDSRYLILSLAENKPHPFNPQHHPLYHTLTGNGFALLSPLFAHEDRTEAAYRFLKGFAVVTGIAFLIALVFLLRAMELPLSIRLAIVLMAGTAVTAWFHFAAVETHSLGMWALCLYLLILFRLIRQSQFGWREQGLLFVALTFAALCRADLWRFIVLTLPLLLVPSLTRFRRRLAVILGTVLAVGLAGYLLLNIFYVGVPLKSISDTLFSRRDRPSLKSDVRTTDNFKSPFPAQMLRATTIYSILAPVGDDYFLSTLKGMTTRPLPCSALVLLALIWARLLWHLLVKLKEKDWFVGIVALQWIAAQVFYTWYNPHEPFLWLLEFLPLFIVLLADSCRRPGLLFRVLLPATAILVCAHNWVYFLLPYR